MPITEQQRIERRQFIGSSDMAAVMGLDPYKSAMDVWLDKRGLLEDVEPTEAMRDGTCLEAGVIEYAKLILGPLTANVPMRVSGLPLSSNIDAIVDASGDPVEAKTHGLRGGQMLPWGDTGTGEVPDHVIIQCHVHMMASGRDICHVPALLGGRGLQMFHVERDGRIVDAIAEWSVRFWRHVETGEAPTDATASPAVVKAIRRVPDKIATIDPSVVQRWLDAKARASEARAEQEDAMAAVLAAMGDAEAAHAGALGAVTYYESSRRGYTVEPTTYRTLRYKEKGL